MGVLAAACTPDFSAIDDKTFCQQNTDCLPGRVCVLSTCIDPTNPPPGFGADVGGDDGGAAGLDGDQGGQFGDAGPGAADAGGGDDGGPGEQGAGQDGGIGEGDAGGQGEVGDGEAGDVGEGEVGEGDAAGDGEAAGQEGGDDGGGAPRPGDVLITEIMVNPGGAQQVQDDNAEWIELENLTDQHFSLNGWTLQDNGSPTPFTFPERGLFEARSIIVVGRSADPNINGGIQPDYIAGDTLRLANEDDRVQLRGPTGDLLDEVAWTAPAWPVHAGGALSLDPNHHNVVDNDAPSSWCPSPAGIVHGGDRGSPGVENPVCPEVAPAYCRDAIDVTAGGLFGWDLALARGDLLADHAYLGTCDSPGVEEPYTIGLGSPDAVFSFQVKFDQRWRIDLRATRDDADLAMYIWAQSCPRFNAEACADDSPDNAGGVDRGHAVIDRIFSRGVDGRRYYIIVDAVTEATGRVSPQPFTLQVLPGGGL